MRHRRAKYREMVEQHAIGAVSMTADNDNTSDVGPENDAAAVGFLYQAEIASPGSGPRLILVESYDDYIARVGAAPSAAARDALELLEHDPNVVIHNAAAAGIVMRGKAPVHSVKLPAPEPL